MSRSTLQKFVAALLLVFPAVPSLAHTSVASTSPKTGSELKASPPVIEIEFSSEARLTSVVAIDAKKSERPLQFTPKSSATAFTLPNPELAPGRNEIRWKALSRDGHVVTGSLVLVINPAAKTAN
jgi:methionine-rich copper-binding protein CopC